MELGLLNSILNVCKFYTLYISVILAFLHLEIFYSFIETLYVKYLTGMLTLRLSMHLEYFLTNKAK